MLVTLPTLALAALPRISLKQLPSQERIFVDELGRQRVFHGANVVVKGPPWLPSRGGFDYQTSLVKEDFELMAEAGMNSIRLGVMWPGVEPKRGEYDETYLQQVRELIDEAASYGIYTFADMHQDVLSEKFCGEGVPAWAANTHQPLPIFKKFPWPVTDPFTDSEDGFPTRQDCSKLSMQGGYASEAAEQAFENLYSNYDGLTDAWGLYWARVAQELLGNPALMGINLINEPFTGNAFLDPLKLLPEHANQILQGAYDIVSRHIREVDPEMLIFFPGVTWTDLQGLAKLNGFSHPPGGPEFANRSVLAFHYYEPPQKQDAESRYIRDFMLANARRLQTGLFLTETWGPMWQKSAPVSEVIGVSWSYWEWKDFCKETAATKAGRSQWAAFGACKTGYGGQLFNDKGIIPEKHQMLGRMYAYAIQGTLSSEVYDEKDRTLLMRYQLDPTIKGPTEIYAHPEWHGGPGGRVLVVTAKEVKATYNATARRITLTATAEAVAGPVDVVVRPLGSVLV